MVALRCDEEDSRMSISMKIYNHLPVFLQNLATTAAGYRIKWQRYGGNSKKYVSQLEKSQWFPLETFTEIQEEKLRKMIEHAYQYVPYYRNLFDERGLSHKDIQKISDLEKIPILEKHVLRERTDEFVSRYYKKRHLIVGHTGGTTGNPLTLYVDKDAFRYAFAFSETRLRHWAGVKSGDRQATFLGRLIVPINVKKPPFWRFNRAFNQMLFSSFHMSENNLGYYMEELKRFQPQTIQGYVSTIYTMAKYILDCGEEGCVQPKAILVSAETLFESQREKIEKAFASRVYNGYSAGDYGGLITQCEKRGLHISPEFGIIELKEKHGKHELITTQLFNYAMPLIRYRIGDLVVPSDRSCPCERKLPLVESIEGRIEGMLITPEGNIISPMTMVDALKSVNNVKETQIVQTEIDKVIVRVVKKEWFSQKDLICLKKQLQERLGKRMSIEVILVDKIGRTRSGKFQVIVSKVFQQDSFLPNEML